MKKATTRPCKKVGCANLAVGFRYCEVCRARKAAEARRYRATHVESCRARSRQWIARYLASGSPKARAYRQRRRPVNAAACRAWVARHPERKALIARLGKLVASGEVERPTHCQDCRKTDAPIVAWGLHEGGDGEPVVLAWTCWSCWWRRRREGRG